MLEPHPDQGMDKPSARILRVGRYACKPSHLEYFPLNVDFHGIDYDLRGKMVLVKPAKHIRCVKNRFL